MKTLTIILIAITIMAVVFLSACSDSDNLKAWQSLFFGTATPAKESTATPASPPGAVEWEVTPEPKELYMPIISQGGEP